MDPEEEPNWQLFNGGMAVLEISGAGWTYWGEIERIIQDGQMLHVYYHGRAAVKKGADHQWELSGPGGLHQCLWISQTAIHDLDGGAVAVDASRCCKQMLFVFPKGYKPKEDKKYQWSQVHGTDEWLDAHASGEAHSSRV